MKKTSTELCLCGSGKTLADCCALLIGTDRVAETAEQLMRSRFTAYAQKNVKYIFDTTDPQVRMDFDMKSNEDWANEVDFFHLDVRATSTEGNKGNVEFIAKYRTKDGAEHLHHEFSKFRRVNGVWYFRDGRVVVQPPANQEQTQSQEK
jgi:SEC-C motif domain protein